jgi:hypothetical protein
MEQIALFPTINQFSMLDTTSDVHMWVVLCMQDVLSFWNLPEQRRLTSTFLFIFLYVLIHVKIRPLSARKHIRGAFIRFNSLNNVLPDLVRQRVYVASAAAARISAEACISVSDIYVGNHGYNFITLHHYNFVFVLKRNLSL